MGKLPESRSLVLRPSITNHPLPFTIRFPSSDYILTYLNRSSNEYVQLKSDWDLENAYLAHTKPHLAIRVQKTSVSNLTDWDIVSTSDLNRVATYAGKQTSQLANNFLNRVSNFFGFIFGMAIRFVL